MIEKIIMLWGILAVVVFVIHALLQMRQPKNSVRLNPGDSIDIEWEVKREQVKQ